MKAHLLYRDRDFDVKQELPATEGGLIQDLGLDTLCAAMASGDKFLFEIARQALLTAPRETIETILYRQAILSDTLQNRSVVQSIYDAAVEGLENRRKQWIGILGHHPSSVLWGAVELMQMSIAVFDQLRLTSSTHGHKFKSDGFKALFALITAELTSDYLAQSRTYLKELKFEGGVLMSAELGRANYGANYILRQSTDDHAWWTQWLGSGGEGFSFRIAERDEGGARILSDMKNRALVSVANNAAQSAAHVLSFFLMLRTELAFYLGCVNLHCALSEKKVPVCFPLPAPAGSGKQSCAGLRDASLVLTMDQSVVQNDLDADGKNLVIITGANQGGKSTFLRSMGSAQLMMQCGMFVAAESFSADVCRNLFTHYKREEDVTMESGKLDEELSRMSDIVDQLTPDTMLLFNEPFAATNEREGSEIARQIIHAFGEARVKIFMVTHLYDFAHSMWKEKAGTTLFLRAERLGDGRRTFKLLPGEPIQTSFGVDLYEQTFRVSPGAAGAT